MIQDRGTFYSGSWMLFLCGLGGCGQPEAQSWWSAHPPEGCSSLLSSIPLFFLVLHVASGQIPIPSLSSPVVPDTMMVPVLTTSLNPQGWEQGSHLDSTGSRWVCHSQPTCSKCCWGGTVVMVGASNQQSRGCPQLVLECHQCFLSL